MFKDWGAAREAFGKGKPEATSLYLDLAKRYPDIPELTGELGNIYFQQGKMAEAATQFYETAQRLFAMNPVYDLVTCARWCLLGLPVDPVIVWAFAGWTIVLPVVGLVFFRRAEYRYGS